MDRLFRVDVPQFTKTLESLDGRLAADAVPERDEILQELTAAIHASSQACEDVELEIGLDSPELAQARAQFRQAIQPWFDKSWFMHRGLSKPRGYPGDYELLTGIYEGQPQTRGLGGYLDLYFLNSDLGRAVVGRVSALKEFLRSEAETRSGEIFALNVACGPCREFANGFELPENCGLHVTCVDNDEAALDYVRQNVQPQTRYNLDLRPVRYNALRMVSHNANVRHFGHPDIIYSVGLCDYIPDRLLIPMLRGWRQMVADGGVVYVAFKDCRRYDKTEYQWHVDWNFFQRTEADCRRLFREAGFDMSGVSATRDESGVIINYAARSLVPAGTQIRVDTAAEFPGYDPAALDTAQRKSSQPVSKAVATLPGR